MNKKWVCHECGAELMPTCFWCGEAMDSEDDVEGHLSTCPKRQGTQMQRLVEWLKCEQKYYTVNDDGSVTDYQGAYGTILDHIRTLEEEKCTQ